jgi:hypothetical protein
MVTVTAKEMARAKETKRTKTKTSRRVSRMNPVKSRGDLPVRAEAVLRLAVA